MDFEQASHDFTFTSFIQEHTSLDLSVIWWRSVRHLTDCLSYILKIFPGRGRGCPGPSYKTCEEKALAIGTWAFNISTTHKKTPFQKTWVRGCSLILHLTHSVLVWDLHILLGTFYGPWKECRPTSPSDVHCLIAYVSHRTL